jgi:hypothetical protein
MKSNAALAALFGVVFAGASVASVSAQSGAPGSAPPKPNKVTSVPTPPPPGGPDKFATNTQPPKPGSGPRSVPHLGYWPSPGPKPIDEFAADPSTKPSTCHAALGGVKYLNCVASLVAICERRGGTLSGTSSSVTCSTN